MKKVGIITLHNAYNYGAVLQAYATLKTFEKLWVNAEFIDYSTEISSITKKFLLFPKNKKDIKHNIRNLRYPQQFFTRKKSYFNCITILNHSDALC